MTCFLTLQWDSHPTIGLLAVTFNVDETSVNLLSSCSHLHCSSYKQDFLHRSFLVFSLEVNKDRKAARPVKEKP